MCCYSFNEGLVADCCRRCCCRYESEDAVVAQMLLAGHVSRGCRVLNTRQRDRNRHVRRLSADRLRRLATAATSQVFTACLCTRM